MISFAEMEAELVSLSRLEELYSKRDELSVEVSEGSSEESSFFPSRSWEQLCSKNILKEKKATAETAAVNVLFTLFLSLLILTLCSFTFIYNAVYLKILSVWVLYSLMILSYITQCT